MNFFYIYGKLMKALQGTCILNSQIGEGALEMAKALTIEQRAKGIVEFIESKIQFKK